MIELNLSKLKEGLPGISKTIGAYLAEAAAFCLTQNQHNSPVELSITGLYTQNLLVIWTDDITEQVKRSWRESIEATEYGATGIAILLLLKLTDYVILERGVIGTGFDYLLCKQDTKGQLLLEEKARLEISGIWRATKTNTVTQRISIKKKQVKKSNAANFPAYIIVIEFSQPTSKFIQTP